MKQRGRRRSKTATEEEGGWERLRRGKERRKDPVRLSDSHSFLRLSWDLPFLQLRITVAWETMRKSPFLKISKPWFTLRFSYSSYFRIPLLFACLHNRLFVDFRKTALGEKMSENGRGGNLQGGKKVGLPWAGKEDKFPRCSSRKVLDAKRAEKGKKGNEQELQKIPLQCIIWWRNSETETQSTHGKNKAIGLFVGKKTIGGGWGILLFGQHSLAWK